MTDRRVKRTGKDREGDITSLCGDWGTASKSSAIVDIELGLNTYFVQDIHQRRADVHVVNAVTGKYLRTEPNAACSDNLDNLPAC